MGRGAKTDVGWIVRLSVAAASCVALANCSSGLSKVDPRYGVSSSPRVVEEGQPVPKGGGTYRVGKPYLVAGRTYTPFEDTHYRAEGMASWYGRDFHGRLTANGEVFDMDGFSAAHPTLPMPCYVRVTNLANRRSMVVRINDRGPYARDRLIDLSRGAAHALDLHGLARVRVEYVGRAPLEGSDDRQLLATLREGAPAPAPSRVMVASARPFVPQYADLAAQTRGRSILVPQDRPFTLGDGQGDGTAAAAPSRRIASHETTVRHLAHREAASRDAPDDVGRAPSRPVREAAALPPKTAAAAQTNFESRWEAPSHIAGIAAATDSPVQAYAPPGAAAPAAFVSGRGLY